MVVPTTSLSAADHALVETDAGFDDVSSHNFSSDLPLLPLDTSVAIDVLSTRSGRPKIAVLTPRFRVLDGG